MGDINTPPTRADLFSHNYIKKKNIYWLLLLKVGFFCTLIYVNWGEKKRVKDNLYILEKRTTVCKSSDSGILPYTAPWTGKLVPGKACSDRTGYRLMRTQSRARDPSSLGLQQ